MEGRGFILHGDEITSTANDREKFATYTRDSYTGLDYADQRYYASAYGRFNTADPYAGSAGPNEPSSWNRYAYVAGDPINHNDRSGLDYSDCGGETFGFGWMFDPCVSSEIDTSICNQLVLAFGPAPDPSCGYVGGGPLYFAPPQSGGGGGSGSGCPSYTSNTSTFYTCFHQSGSDWNKLAGTLRQIDKRLQKDPQCDTFLTAGGLTMSQINSDLLNPSSTFTLAGTIVNIPTGQVLAGTTNDVSGQTSIIISSLAFMGSNQSTNYLTILHELSHLGGVIPADGTPASSAANDLTVEQNCFKTIGIGKP